MDFLRYCKNHFKYKIFKLLLYVIIGIIILLITGSINIATVHASDVICNESPADATYSYHRLEHLSDEMDKLQENFSLALDHFISNYNYERYIVSLRINTAMDSDYSFYFYKVNSTLYNSYNGINWFEILSTNQVRYSFTNGDIITKGEHSSGSYTITYGNYKDTCTVDSLTLFYSNFPVNFGDLNKSFLAPIYGAEYTHQSINSSAPTIVENLFPDLESQGYLTLDLDVAPWLVLYLKDYENTESFTSKMFFKGMVCPQPVYEYGTSLKENFVDRCTVNFDSYTRTDFHVLESDIVNHAVYYFKGYQPGASIKISPNDFEYQYIYDEENPTLTIDGETYNILRYNSEDIPGNAVENEGNNKVPGESENFFESLLDTLKDFFDNFFTKLKELFIPETNYFSNWFTDFKTFFEVKLGFLTTPFTIIIDFLDYYLNLSSSNEIIIDIPEIKVPNFEQHSIISATTFNWSELLNSKSVFKNLWILYLDFIDVILILKFIGLCHNKYNRIFGGDVVNDN